MRITMKSPTGGAVSPASGNGFDLDDIRRVALTAHHEAATERARAQMIGSQPWVERRDAELRSVLALTQVSDKVHVLGLNPVEELRFVLGMRVTVPCMPDPAGGELVVRDHAVLELRYPQEVMTQNLPGPSFVRVAQPGPVWLANGDPMHGVLCLGGGPSDSLRNVSVLELIWLAYSALAGQLRMTDERDPAGVMNLAAARYWSLNQHRLPLTNEPLVNRAQFERAMRGGTGEARGGTGEARGGTGVSPVEGDDA